MDIGIALTSAKALIEFLKTGVELYGNQRLSEKGARRLFSLYVAVSQFVEDLDEYFSILRTQIVGLDAKSPRRQQVLWEINKLAESVARKHYEIYRLLDGLEYRVKPHDEPLAKYVREARGWVSKSTGYQPDEIAIITSYRAAASPMPKLNTLRRAYKVSIRNGGVLVGDIPTESDPRFRQFLDIHEAGRDFMVRFVAELERVVREQFELNDLL